MKLDKVLAEHRARRKADKLAVLTMITKPVSERHRAARLGEQPLTLVLDPENQRLLHYDEASAGHMSLETALFSEHRDVQIRTDLLDCHIDICAPEVGTPRPLSSSLADGRSACSAVPCHIKLDKRISRNVPKAAESAQDFCI